MTNFLFLLVFFLSFSSFLPFETAGMSSLSDTYLRMTNSAGLTCFFFIFFSFPPFIMAGLDILFFFFSFYVFWDNICILKTQIRINKNILMIMMININLFEHIIHNVINYRLFILGQFLLI